MCSRYRHESNSTMENAQPKWTALPAYAISTTVLRKLEGLNRVCILKLSRLISLRPLPRKRALDRFCQGNRIVQAEFASRTPYVRQVACACEPRHSLAFDLHFDARRDRLRYFPGEL